MSRVERTVLTNMCMVTDGSRVLVQQRSDPKWPGIVFPGGHVEPGESFVDSTVREVYEETGLNVSNLRLWIKRNGEVSEKLRETGYRTHSKIFTPRQVRILVEIFGEP